MKESIIRKIEITIASIAVVSSLAFALFIIIKTPTRSTEQEISQQWFNAGAVAHSEGRVTVTVLPDGSKVVITVNDKK